MPLDAIPNLSIGGWGGWAHAIGSSMAFKNAVGDRITTYCIFDSDYHTTQEQTERYAQANERAIDLHIWKRKEIENYLLDHNVIARVIKQRAKVTPPTGAAVQAFLLQACDEEKDIVFDAIATHLGHQDRSLGPGGANKAARTFLDQRWQHKPHIVSVKALLSRLNTWTQHHYKVSLGAMAIAKAFHPSEIPAELRSVLTRIEEGMTLPLPEQ